MPPVFGCLFVGPNVLENSMAAKAPLIQKFPGKLLELEGQVRTVEGEVSTVCSKVEKQLHGAGRAL